MNKFFIYVTCIVAYTIFQPSNAMDKKLNILDTEDNFTKNYSSNEFLPNLNPNTIELTSKNFKNKKYNSGNTFSYLNINLEHTNQIIEDIKSKKKEELKNKKENQKHEENISSSNNQEEFKVPQNVITENKDLESCEEKDEISDKELVIKKIVSVKKGKKKFHQNKGTKKKNEKHRKEKNESKKYSKNKNQSDEDFLEKLANENEDNKNTTIKKETTVSKKSTSEDTNNLSKELNSTVEIFLHSKLSEKFDECDQIIRKNTHLTNQVCKNMGVSKKLAEMLHSTNNQINDLNSQIEDYHSFSLEKKSTILTQTKNLIDSQNTCFLLIIEEIKVTLKNSNDEIASQINSIKENQKLSLPNNFEENFKDKIQKLEKKIDQKKDISENIQYYISIKKLHDQHLCDLYLIQLKQLMANTKHSEN